MFFGMSQRVSACLGVSRHVSACLGVSRLIRGSDTGFNEIMGEPQSLSSLAPPTQDLARREPMGCVAVAQPAEEPTKDT